MRIPWLAFILITVGVVLLFSEFGYIDFRWQDLLRFWPVILIFWGLDILASNQRWAGWITALLLIILLIFVFLVSPLAGRLGVRQFNWWSGEGAYYKEWKLPKDAEVSVLDLTLKTGIGNVLVKALSEDKYLVSLSLPASTKLQEERKKQGDMLRLKLNLDERKLCFWKEDRGQVNLLLSPEPEIGFNLEAGIGTNELDFRDLRVSNFRIKGGVGTITAYLSPITKDAEIDGGIGKITIYVPDSVYIVLNGETGLGKIKVDDNVKRFNGESGVKVVNLRVSSGIGEILIKSVRDTI